MRRSAAAAGAVAVILSAAAAPAAAALRLTHVDSGGYPTIRVTVVSSAGSASVPRLTENGAPVTGLAARNLATSKAVVLAVDASRSMGGRPLSDAVAGARTFVAAESPSDRIAAVEFGPRAIPLGDLSASKADADAALSSVRLARRDGTALYDAVVLAAKKLAESPLAGRVLVLLTDGRDVSSAHSLGAAVAAARAAHVAIYAIGIEGRGFDPAALRELARSTGGSYYPAATTRSLGTVYRAVAARLSRTWQLSYVTAARPGDTLHLRVDAAGAGSALATSLLPIRSGDVSAGSDGQLPGGAYTPGGTLAFAAIVGGLVMLAVLLLLAARRGSWLASRLAAHTGGSRRLPRRRSGQRLAAFAALLRATERAFGHLQKWRALQSMLDRGETPFRAAEFLWLAGGTGVGLGLLAAVAGSSAIVILFVMLVGAAAPFAVAWRRMRRRLNAFEDQLPDMMIAVAASLKAGHSFKQGLQAVVDEGHPPTSDELKRVLTEAGLGRPMDEGLAEMAERVSSKNFEFAITAVTIQRQVGGSLANLFDLVADTVRQRQQFARKIRSLTAMGRMSAYTLIGLPFLIAGAILLINASYLNPLIHTGAGHVMVFLGFGMLAIGSLILRKIVSFRG